MVDTFLMHFCRVEFVCYGGIPNWLGWLALGYGVVIVLDIFIKLDQVVGRRRS